MHMQAAKKRFANSTHGFLTLINSSNSNTFIQQNAYLFNYRKAY
ncbi:hypothetical protein T01_5954 [Trichinella spiralis]|uniref:Uncharacterized protein n=1 Tax=Trichinella spiralis TaxID=6334 RepID=A0A0V0Z0X8_TRISP|nr:hypothetical protein T01_5954 [Trichinella spiralis]